jgi:hypothetical protein
LYFLKTSVYLLVGLGSMGDRTKLQRKMFAGELIDMVNPNGHSRPSGS